MRNPWWCSVLIGMAIGGIVISIFYVFISH
jgi:hypothetical protein